MAQISASELDELADAIENLDASLAIVGRPFLMVALVSVILEDWFGKQGGEQKNETISGE